MIKPITVLSCFDGSGTGRDALEAAGIPIKKYYASEIDKYASSVCRYNFIDVEHLGNILNWREWPILWHMVDLLIGGSPCQGFSYAGKQLAFDDPRSVLFFVMMEIRDHINVERAKHGKKPVRIFLENVKMKKEFEDVITQYMGVEPVKINSSLVSAQNRQRLYWHNWEADLPEDQGIYLKDILEDEVDEKYYMGENWLKWWKEKKEFQLKKKYSSLNPDKAITMTARQYASWNGNYILQVPEATKKGFTVVEPGDCVDLTFPTSKTRRGRNMKNKSNCLTAAKYDYCQFTLDHKIRKLTPIECERLQTLRDNFTAFGLTPDFKVVPISDSQRYKMLGNGWTKEVIVNRFKGLKLWLLVNQQ